MMRKPRTCPLRHSRAGRLQFSVLAMLIVVTVVAAVSPLLPYAGQQLVKSILSMLAFVVLPVCLGAFALYCRGRRQAFFLGAAAASAAYVLALGLQNRSSVGGVVEALVLQLASCGICGYLAVRIRQFVQRAGWDRPEPEESE